MAEGGPSEVIAGLQIAAYPARPYLAIGVVTPFRGMGVVRDRLWAELYRWLDAHKIAPFGSAFMRLNVIDMRGPMDLEMGVLTPTKLDGDDRVRPGEFPAGEYATLTIRHHTLRAHRIIGDWMDAEGRTYDAHPVAAGDRFACRYELNVTDPRLERRKTQWITELGFMVRPQHA